jgi:hypothetical protein
MSQPKAYQLKYSVVVEFIDLDNVVSLIDELLLLAGMAHAPAGDLEERPRLLSELGRHLDALQFDHGRRIRLHDTHRFDLLRQITDGDFTARSVRRERQRFAGDSEGSS